MVKGKKTLRTTADIVQLDNVLQKDSVREKAEKIPADVNVNSQESQYVNVPSQIVIKKFRLMQVFLFWISYTMKVN